MQRHTLVSPYHYCGVCGIRSDLSSMTRQRGVLVDTTHSACYDEGSKIGEREAEIAKKSQHWDTELQPDKKLNTPTVESDDISFQI